METSVTRGSKEAGSSQETGRRQETGKTRSEMGDCVKRTLELLGESESRAMVDGDRRARPIKGRENKSKTKLRKSNTTNLTSSIQD